jgi:hypothetical protein
MLARHPTIAVFVVFTWAACMPVPARGQDGGPPARSANPRSSVFPLLADLIPPEYRASLPLPFGVSLAAGWMNGVVPLTDAKLSIAGLRLPQSVLTATSVTSSTALQAIRADLWLFPFLNVYGLAGRLSGEARDLTLQLNGPLPLPVVLPRIVPVEGSAFGVGLAPAIGYRGVFAAYDVNWVWMNADVLEEPSRVLTQTPRVGFSAGDERVRVAVFAGRSHQSYAGRQRGSMRLAGGVQLGWDAIAQPEAAWNTVLGGQLTVARHFTIDVEQGLGKRRHTLIALGGRF